MQHEQRKPEQDPAASRTGFANRQGATARRSASPNGQKAVRAASTPKRLPICRRVRQSAIATMPSSAMPVKVPNSRRCARSPFGTACEAAQSANTPEQRMAHQAGDARPRRDEEFAGAAAEGKRVRYAEAEGRE